MAFAYLLDPVNQYQDRRGVNNVNGFFKVFRADTDDTATTYKDFNGTLNPERIPIDNNGRAVIIVESGRPYRVEMYLPNGSLEFTQYPVYPLASGGGLTMVNIESTDGSVKVDKTVVGGQATFDLSVYDADPQYLDWAKCALANTPETGTMVPLKVQGTMDANEHGLVLKAGNLYHVTARFVATKNEAQPFYDNVTLMFKTFDGESDAIVLSLNRIIDYSLGLSQEFDVSADVKVGSNDVSLYFAYSDKDVNQGEIRFLTADIHKLFSGVPQLPEGVASTAWVSDHFQEKLEAGEGITIVGNVISATAQQQQQADWAEDDPEDVTFIRNKPSLATVATSGSYNDLSDKPSIPAAQVQSDWSEADNSKADFIKNKPNLATVATSGSYNDLSDKPNIPSQQVQSDWTEADSSKPAYIKNKPNLATVATSGSYNDLTDKPSIPAAQVQSDWSEADNTKADFIKNKPNLAAVATSGDYNDLQNRPTIPEGVPSYSTADIDKVLGVVDNQGAAVLDWVSKGGGGTQVQADWTEQDSAAADYIKNKPNLASVATSGSYNDLSDKPSIPAAQVQSDWNEADSSKVDYIKNKPNLATVATTGDYDDLSNKPSIPVIPAMKNLVAGNNVTITEDANGVTISASGGGSQVQSDWDQTNPQAADYIKNKPTIPAAQVQSDWNQSNSSAVDYIKNKPSLATVATSGSYDDLSDKPSIPAAQVQSDWSQSNSQAVDFIKNKPSLASVATSGDYDDLSNKPSIPAAQVQSDWSQSDNTQVDYIKNKPSLASVATSGSYNDLSDKPTIPAAPVQSNWNESDSSSLAYIQNKPSLASVATSGDYEDLSNKPTIPAAQVQSDWNQSDSQSVDYIKNKPAIPGVEVESNSFTLTDSSDDEIEVDYTPTVITQSDLHVANEVATLFDNGVGYTYIHLANAWDFPVGTKVRVVLHSDVVTYINAPIQISENPSGNPFTAIGEIARTPDNKILAGTYEFTTTATASEYYIRLVTTGPAAELTELGVGDFDVYVNPVDTRKTTIPAEYVAGSGISITTNQDGTKTISLDIPVADTEAF